MTIDLAALLAMTPAQLAAAAAAVSPFGQLVDERTREIVGDATEAQRDASRAAVVNGDALGVFVVDGREVYVTGANA